MRKENLPATTIFNGTEVDIKQIITEITVLNSHVQNFLDPLNLIIKFLAKEKDLILREQVIPELAQLYHLASNTPIPLFKNVLPSLYVELSNNLPFVDERFNDFYKLIDEQISQILEVDNLHIKPQIFPNPDINNYIVVDLQKKTVTNNTPKLLKQESPTNESSKTETPSIIKVDFSPLNVKTGFSPKNPKIIKKISQPQNLEFNSPKAEQNKTKEEKPQIPPQHKTSLGTNPPTLSSTAETLPLSPKIEQNKTKEEKTLTTPQHKTCLGTNPSTLSSTTETLPLSPKAEQYKTKEEKTLTPPQHKTSLEPEFFIFDDVLSHTSMRGDFYEIDSSEGQWNSDKIMEGGNIGHRPSVKSGYFPVPPVDSLQDLRSAICGTNPPTLFPTTETLPLSPKAEQYKTKEEKTLTPPQHKTCLGTNPSTMFSTAETLPPRPKAIKKLSPNKKVEKDWVLSDCEMFLCFISVVGWSVLIAYAIYHSPCFSEDEVDASEDNRPTYLLL
ncbi:MAG: hypothetical protein H0U73_00415 [Tatlockia sp.]|nr:hypothetical protein [Tatlockia sp.]